jgi:hypothetical protein
MSKRLVVVIAGLAGFVFLVLTMFGSVPSSISTAWKNPGGSTKSPSPVTPEQVDLIRRFKLPAGSRLHHQKELSTGSETIFFAELPDQTRKICAIRISPSLGPIYACSSL